MFFSPHEFYMASIIHHPPPTHGRGILRLGFIYHLPNHSQKSNEDLLNWPCFFWGFNKKGCVTTTKFYYDLPKILSVH